MLKGHQFWGHNSKWPSSLPTSCSHVDYPSWMLEGRQLGVTTLKWPLSLLTTCSHVSYPSWTLEGHPLAVMTPGGLLVFLPFAVVLVIQARRKRGVIWGSRLQMAFKSPYHSAAMPVIQARHWRGVSWGSQIQMTFKFS